MTDGKNKELTPQVKRAKRIESFLNPHVQFVNGEYARLYRERAQRIVDVHNVEEPDRVPVALTGGALPAYLTGMDYRTAMFDYDRVNKAWIDFNREFDSDMLMGWFDVIPGTLYELLDYKLYAWPGHGLPMNATGFQYIEGEYMKADEYDAFIRDPSDFFMRTYMPRIFSALKCYKTMEPLVYLTEVPLRHFMPYASPEVRAVQQKLIDVGKELTRWVKAISEFEATGIASGFPSVPMMLCKAPFDTLGDTMRDTKGIMMDMYRQPDKVLQAVDVLADLSIEATIANANAMGTLIVSFPLHKGADGWMNKKQFDTLYWPSLRKVINALIEEGIMVRLFAEGAFNTRLESVNEFPKGFVHWYFDKTDMARAKKLVGDNCSIQGNLSSSLLVAGTPEDVREECRKLIEICAPGGGYILSSGAAGVTEAKPENLKAMIEAAREYGRY